MPLHDRFMRLAARGAGLFYQLEIAGARTMVDGPLLVVANHPNSLLDPALVTLATGRVARFLAKAPLFTDPKVSALVRLSGAIPVYRKQDGDAPAGANDDTFRAAEAALLSGEAIALFPEGISHANPARAPLKTGAARLALQTAARLGRAFPIVPVGITLDDRAIFRSHGLLVVGDAVSWDDLAHDAARDVERPSAPDRVRALTARIASAIDTVTVSYASWDDARLVALAELVHHTDALDAPARLDRRRIGAALLARLRREDTPPAVRAEVDALGADLRRHARLLRTLRLAPGDLSVRTDVISAAHWARRRAHLVLLGALAALGTLLGWVPYRITGRVAGMFPGADESDVIATSKALVGALAFIVWTVLLAAVAGWLLAWWAALLVLLLVPPLLVVALLTAEGWQEAWHDARRFLTLRRHADRVAELRERQRALAARIDALVAQLELLAGAATA